MTAEVEVVVNPPASAETTSSTRTAAQDEAALPPVPLRTLLQYATPRDKIQYLIGGALRICLQSTPWPQCLMVWCNDAQ